MATKSIIKGTNAATKANTASKQAKEEVLDEKPTVVETPVVETKVVEEKPADNSAQEIAALKAQIDMLMKLVAANNTQPQAAAPAPSQTDPNSFIKIVHLVQRGPGLSTYMKIGNVDFILTEFGEERYLTVQQFEEMLGKYRRWFDSGMLSVAAGYDEVAARYGLKTAKDYPMDSEFVKNLGALRMEEIERMYERLPESGKEFIISYWKRKIIAGDPKFKDARKIEVLNRISDGAMDNVLVDLRAEKK